MKVKPPSRRKATHLQNAVCPHPLLLPCTPYSSCPDRPTHQTPCFRIAAGRRHGNEAQGLRDHGTVPEGQGSIHGAEDLKMDFGIKGRDRHMRTHTHTHTHAYTHLDAKGPG